MACWLIGMMGLPVFSQGSELEICNCDGSSGSLVAVSEPGTFNDTYTQVYLLLDENGAIIQVSSDGTFPDVETGEYTVYALNYDPADLLINDITDNIEIGDTLLNNLTVGNFESPCHDLAGPGEATVNQCALATETMLSATTCDPLMAGMSTVTLATSSGCDSLVTTNTTLLASDTTRLTVSSCDIDVMTIDTVFLQASVGCDSLVITTNIPLSDSQSNFSATTCIPINVGIDTTILLNAVGCDSLVITATTLSASDTTFLSATTCDPALAVNDTITYAGQICDSTVITITNLLASDQTNLVATTCDPSMVGIDTMTMANAVGCDSLVITETTLLASSQTNLTATSCDMNAVGIDTMTMANAVGCDSLVITETTFVESDETVLPDVLTCDVNLVGLDTVIMTNQGGCDSLVITNTILDNCTNPTVLEVCNCDGSAGTLVAIAEPGTFDENKTQVYLLLDSNGAIVDANDNGTFSSVATGVYEIYALNYDAADANANLVTDNIEIGDVLLDNLAVGSTASPCYDLEGPASASVNQCGQNTETNLTATTCDMSMAGVETVTMMTQNGCDSLVITTTTFVDSDETNLSATTCDPAMVGMATVTLMNSAGCDSLVITTTTLSESDTTRLELFTCDAAMVGSDTVVLAGQLCDSLVITTTTLLASSETNLDATTCDPAMVGVETETLTNAAGCDSLVTTTTTLLASSQTDLTATTCDPALVGVETETLVNAAGCDSLVVTTTTLSDTPGNTMDIVQPTCAVSTGSVSLTDITTIGFNYGISSGSTFTGTTDIASVDGSNGFADLAAGEYVIRIVSADGCSIDIAVTLVEAVGCNPSTNITNVCPCNGDVPTIVSEAEPGTFTEEGHTQVYIFTDTDGDIIMSNTTGSFDVSALDDGGYLVYALNFANVDSAGIVPVYEDGLNVSGFTTGNLLGCFEFLGPQAVSVNAFGCGCVVDCGTVTAPLVTDINVCSGGSTLLDLTTADCSELFFSEYIEGSGQNKALEIFNPTGAVIDLAPYRVKVSGNGGQFLNQYDLTGFIQPGGVFLIANIDADLALSSIADVTLDFPSVVHFNGDDAIFLVDTLAMDTLDLIGQIGVDPGDSWIVGSGATRDFTLIRNSTITEGNDNWNGGQNEWDVQAQDYFDDYGTHNYTPDPCPGISYNFYADAALSDLVSGGALTYDPMTANGTSTELWITKLQGDCESDPTAISVLVSNPPSATLADTAFVCNGTDGAYSNTIDLNDFILTGPTDGTGSWTDAMDNPLTTTVFNGDTIIPNIGYTYNYTVNPPSGSTCDAISTSLVLFVENCTGDPCTGIQAPIVNDITLCGDASTEVTPFGGGFNSQSVLESFDDWFDGSYGGLAFYTDPQGGMWESFNTISGDDNALSGNVIRFNDDSGMNEYLQYNGLDGNGKDNGIGLISFYYAHWNGNDAAVSFQVQYSTDGGTTWENVGEVTSATTTDYTLFSEVVNLSENDVLVRIISIEDDERLLIDDLVITDAVNLIYSFYSDAGLTNLLNSGETYDPMTASGSTDSIWVSVAVDGCESEAAVMAVVNNLPPSATVPSSYALCDVEGGANPTSINLDDLVTDGPNNAGNAFWFDSAGNLVFPATANAADIGTDSTAVYSLTILPGDPSCDPVSYDVSISVDICDVAGPCDNFAAPTVMDIAICEGEGSTEIIPSGGGNGSAVQYNFYTDIGLTTLMATGSSYDPAAAGQVWVTATDATCESEAAVVTIEISSATATATVTDGQTICNVANDFVATQIFLVDLVTGETGGTFTDADGNTVTEADGTVLGIGTYNYTYTIAGNGNCTDNVYTFSLIVDDCAVTDCSDFALPFVNDIAICEGEGSTEIIPTGGGFDNSVVSYNFYTGSTLITNGTSFDPGAAGTFGVSATDGDCESGIVPITIEISPATPTAFVESTTICDSPAEGNSTVVLIDLITSGDMNGMFLDEDGNTAMSVDGEALGAGEYDYTYVIEGSGSCSGNSYLLTVTVEDCDVDPCNSLIAAPAVICNPQGSLYNLLITMEGGDAGENGYIVTNNFTGEVSNASGGPNVQFGPFEGGTGYSFTIAVADNPDCSTTIEETLVDCVTTSVELLSFDGTVKVEGNYLFWTTASERDNDQFVLMHSKDGQNFTAVNEQSGAGNSNVAANYDFMHVDAPIGINYYRLDQYDFDGTMSRSNIVVLFRNAIEGILSISPVPAYDFMQVKFNSLEAGEMLVQIHDAAGRLVDQKSLFAESGDNSLQWDVTSYANGIYFLSVKQGNEVMSRKFIKE